MGDTVINIRMYFLDRAVYILLRIAYIRYRKVLDSLELLRHSNCWDVFKVERN